MPSDHDSLLNTHLGTTHTTGNILLSRAGMVGFLNTGHNLQFARPGSELHEEAARSQKFRENAVLW